MQPNAVPTSPDAFRQAVMARVLRLGTLLATLISLAYGVGYWAAGRWTMATIEAVALVAFVSAYLLTRKHQNTARGLTALMHVAWFSLAAVVVAQDGLAAPALFWLLTLTPLMILGGLWSALPLTVATIVLVIALLVAHTVGWLPPVSGATVAWHRAASAILILLVFAFFARYSLRWRQSLADELAAARDEAIHHNRVKDQFIAHLNHEIRTPLNALATATEVLSQQQLAPLPRTLVNAQLVATRHLLSLINNVLDHARLTSAGVALDPHPFRVSDVVAQVATMFEPAAADKGIALRVIGVERETGSRLGDATRLRQILANLTSNAVKFTARGGVEIEVMASVPDDADQLTIQVRDSGSGMDDAALQRLFTPYAQLDPSVPRRYGGSGLGLAICRELATLMGGTIQAASEPARGSRFTLTLPMPRVPDTKATPAGQPSSAQTPLAALLVEDDATNRVIVAAALEQLGAQVDMAESGDVALQRRGQRSYDLVLLDRHMPGTDGLDTLRRWRALEQQDGSGRTPIVALTGEADPTSRAEFIQAGADDVITKPVAMDRLRQLLDRVRSQHGRHAARGAPDAGD
jgi:signal transduction histidine kinase/CheY-like chemotaxis protein